MSLNEFKSGFYGGTRQNRFLIIGNFPTQQETTNTSIPATASGANPTGTSFLHVRSTLIPTLQTSTVSYDYFGRKYHYPGEKLYSTWSVAIMDDNPTSVSTSYNLWKKFQQWHDWINNHQTNRTSYATYPESYKVSWAVQHLDLNGNVLKTFNLHGLWPRTINEVSFNMSRPNVINTFNVVFVYDTITINEVTNIGIT